MRFGRLIVFDCIIGADCRARAGAAARLAALEDETLRHFQAVLRLDTSNPPGNEHLVVDYLKQVLDNEGIPSQIFALDPNRPNLVARLKGNGSKRPLLIMGHTDVVNVDPAKWKHPPFSATRDGGYVYGRGTVDDKDNLTAGADDDAAAEAAERAARSRRDLPGRGGRGRHHRASASSSWSNEHFAGDRRRVLPRRGRRRDAHRRRRCSYADRQTLEKIPRGIELVARGISGHGSVPLEVERHRPPRRRGRDARRRGGPRSGSTRRRGAYFRRLAAISPPDGARHYRDVLSTDPKVARGGGRLAVRERAAALVDAAHVGVAEHLHRRLPLQRDSVRGEGDARRARAARRGSGAVPRAGRSRSSTIRRSRCASRRRRRRPPGARRAPRLGSRSRRSRPRSTQHLQRADAADDEHRRDRHGAAAREGGCSASASAPRPTSRTARRASARTATRSACSRASCTASCASTATSWRSSLARSSERGRASVYAPGRRPASRIFCIRRTFSCAWARHWALVSLTSFKKSRWIVR